jgi:putative SOS response-associated peptidase YedK
MEIMCGRFTLRAPASLIAEEFGLLEALPLEPRFNIAPSQPVAAVRMVSSPISGSSGSRCEPREAVPFVVPPLGGIPPEGGTTNGRFDEPCTQKQKSLIFFRELVFLRWGLIPPWATDPAVGNRMINARAETAATRPAFRAALRRRRCLVLADGFYEWRSDGRRKQPFLFHRPDQRPFGFAGLWETWEGPDHRVVESCTLLTTEANAVVRPIHNRMPVILLRDAHAAWLDPAVEDPSPLAALLRPYPEADLVARPVSPYVNSPTHDDPRCIEEEHTLF